MKIKALIALPIGFIIGVAAFALLAVMLQPSVAAAHDDDKKTESSQKEETKKTTDYVYTAQAGDSYSELARKATQTYGINNKVNLSGAQIVFVETNLTQVAGSPELNLGQHVTITQSSVKEWVEKAQKLTNTEQASWNYYVQFVDFNTNAIGEARS